MSSFMASGNIADTCPEVPDRYVNVNAGWLETTKALRDQVNVGKTVYNDRNTHNHRPRSQHSRKKHSGRFVWSNYIALN